MGDRCLTIKGFLNEFVDQHVQRPDRPFCFILGAGASRPSGIPTGQEMAATWLQEIYELENHEGLSLEQWSAPERLGIDDFAVDRVGEFYPLLYDRRFADREEPGFAFLEAQMEGKEPSYGYSVLAYLLSETRHKIVITTNFDNLVADSLSIHAERFPIVVSHDALARYVRTDLRRPLVAKVHGGLGFSPKSKEQDLGQLSEEWKRALTHVFERYTPIVVGYEGNDGSLMKCLESLPDGAPDTIFWCLYAPDEDIRDRVKKVPERVRAFVDKKRGRFVPIAGFDPLMQLLLTQLQERGKIQIPDLFERLKERARRREGAYDDQMRKTHVQVLALSQRAAAPSRAAPTTSNKETVAQEESTLLAKAAGELARSRQDRPWWAWEAEAKAEPDVDKRDAIYRAAIDALPQSAELLANYAIFLGRSRGDLDGAEAVHEQAVAASAGNLDTSLKTLLLGNYAAFLLRERMNAVAAEKLYERAIALDPVNPRILNAYASLELSRGDVEKAGALYKRAVETDEPDAHTLGSYALFLHQFRKDANGAEAFFKRAFEQDPNNAATLSRYVRFIKDMRGDLLAVEAMYGRALTAKPESAELMSDYARLLRTIGKDMDAAEALYKQAIHVDGGDVKTLVNYAVFLQQVRKDMDLAEVFYARASEADSRNIQQLNHLAFAHYADFCQLVRKDVKRADELYRRAVGLAPKDPQVLANYSNFLFLRGDKIEGIRMLDRAAEQNPEIGEQLELSFYRLAHVRSSWPGELRRTRELIERGVRSPGWPLESHVVIAEADGHPDPSLLAALARVISGSEDVAALSAFPEWNRAEAHSPSDERPRGERAAPVDELTA